MLCVCVLCMCCACVCVCCVCVCVLCMCCACVCVVVMLCACVCVSMLKYGEMITCNKLLSYSKLLVAIGYIKLMHPQQRGESATEKITARDAAMFPLYASAGLFGLYLFFRYLSKDYVNLLLSIYFFGLGVGALTRVTR